MDCFPPKQFGPNPNKLYDFLPILWALHACLFKGGNSQAVLGIKEETTPTRQKSICLQKCVHTHEQEGVNGAPHARFEPRHAGHPKWHRKAILQEELGTIVVVVGGVVKISPFGHKIGAPIFMMLLCYPY